MVKQGRFESELKSINRDGVHDLIEYLKDEDFFKKPASIQHHHSNEGGLMQHSWEVYTIYKGAADNYETEIPPDSIKIEGLLHDLVKIQSYTQGRVTITSGQDSYLKTLLQESRLAKKYDIDVDYTDDGRIATSKQYASKLIDYLKTGEDVPPPEREQKWDYNDEWELPAGHGEASVMLLQDFIWLRDREKLAIRWHMGAWEDEVTGAKNRQFNQATQKYPDVMLLQIADYESTFMDMHEFN